MKTFRRISQASARSASVLNSLTSHASAKFTSVLNLLISHVSAKFTSVLNSFTVCSIISFSSVKVINTESDKIKMNSFFTFKLSVNIQLWILEVNDYFILWKVTDVNAQVTVTCFYLRDTLQHHTQCLRLAEDVESFSIWLKLQVWLLVNYSLSVISLKVNLAINKLQMQLKESVQFFTNWFKTIVIELKWNESAVTAAFRRKLNNDISEMIHFLWSVKWLKTFTEFK